MTRYLDPAKVTAVRRTALPSQRLDSLGYTKPGGTPSDTMLKLGGRWYRVMFLCFGTGSTSIIKVNGESVIIPHHDLVMLQQSATSTSEG